jgi:hypothetical protein
LRKYCIISNRWFFLKSFILFLPLKDLHFTLQVFCGNLDLVKMAPLYRIAKVLLAAGQTTGSFSFLQIIAGGTGGGGAHLYLCP